MDLPDPTTTPFSQIYRGDQYGGEAHVLREENPSGVTAVIYGIARPITVVGGAVVYRTHIVFNDQVFSGYFKDVRDGAPRPGNGEEVQINWGDASDGDDFPEIT